MNNKTTIRYRDPRVESIPMMAVIVNFPLWMEKIKDHVGIQCLYTVENGETILVVASNMESVYIIDQFNDFISYCVGDHKHAMINTAVNPIVARKYLHLFRHSYKSAININGRYLKCL